MHVNVGVVGKRGCGKTCCVVELIDRMKYDKIFLISPTLCSNYEMLSRLNIEEENIFQDPNDISILDEIVERIQEEADILEEYRRKLKLYNFFIKNINNNKFLSDDELLRNLWDDSIGEIRKPEHWLDGRKCRIAIMIDDCLSSNIFIGRGLRKLNNLIIKHRHQGGLKVSKGALGCSLFFLVQAYTSNTGGLSKTIRNNLTGLILFKTKNKKEFDQVALELGGEIDKTLFENVYNYAVADEYSFLFVDMHCKPNHPSKYRKNFNEFIICDQLQEKLDDIKDLKLEKELDEKLTL